MGGDGGAGPTDAWTTLAGLARETSTIRLGTLVTSATFRLPGPLAVQVAGVDQMSGGRVELGLGAGLVRGRAHGIRHPLPAARRALRPARGAARGHHRAVGAPQPGETFSHNGNPLPRRRLPRPRQAGPGGRRADHHRRRRQAPHARPGGEVCRRVQRAVHVGRRGGPALRAGPRSGARGRTRPGVTDAARRPRSSASGGTRRRCGGVPTPSGATSTSCATNGLAGSPDEVVEKIAAFEAVGAERLYLQVLDLVRPRPPGRHRRGRAAPGPLTTSVGRRSRRLLFRSQLSSRKSNPPHRESSSSGLSSDAT